MDARSLKELPSIGLFKRSSCQSNCASATGLALEPRQGARKAGGAAPVAALEAPAPYCTLN
jgi:hypothetical protein